MIVLRLVCKGKLLLSTLMVSVMCLCFNMQEEDTNELIIAKCLLCALYSAYRPSCNIGIHLITLLNRLKPRY